MFNIGDRVYHKKFGEGTVSNFSHYDDSIVVTFDEGGTTFGVFTVSLVSLTGEQVEQVEHAFPPNCS